MSTYKTYCYTIARCAIDKFAAAVRLALGAFADFGWLHLANRRNAYHSEEQ